MLLLINKKSGLIRAPQIHLLSVLTATGLDLYHLERCPVATSLACKHTHVKGWDWVNS